MHVFTLLTDQDVTGTLLNEALGVKQEPADTKIAPTKKASVVTGQKR